MAATIKIKNSSTTGSVPTSSNLVQGELAVNVTDLGLYTENASGTVVKLNAPSIDDKNTGATKYLTIDTSGNLGLGVTPSAWGGGRPAFEMSNSGAAYVVNNGTGALVMGTNHYYNGSDNRYKNNGYATEYATYSGLHAWFTAPSGTAGNSITFTQAMTLDASGNLGVGSTSPNIGGLTRALTLNTPAAGNYSGVELAGAGTLSARFITNNAGTYIGSQLSMPLVFETNATERARIDSSGNLDMTGSGSVGRSAGGSGIYFGTNAVLPSSGTALSDNAKSMGNASWRWSVIYAGTGTINTSDANLKQDVQALTNAERNVATAIKGLIKTFRFKDAVAEKGDAARIHVGVMAQAVKAAFEAEGLDANRYALFCSDTWIDEETNEEKTRLGIRYEELLAFVIAAI